MLVFLVLGLRPALFHRTPFILLIVLSKTLCALTLIVLHLFLSSFLTLG